MQPAVGCCVFAVWSENLLALGCPHNLPLRDPKGFATGPNFVSYISALWVYQQHQGFEIFENVKAQFLLNFDQIYINQVLTGRRLPKYLRIYTSQKKNYQIGIKIEQKLGLYFSKLLKSLMLWIATQCIESCSVLKFIIYILYQHCTAVLIAEVRSEIQSHPIHFQLLCI